MKKLIGWVILIGLSIICILFIKGKKQLDNNYIYIDNGRLNLVYKGVNGAIDFQGDGENLYVAFKNKIEVIPNNAKQYLLIKENNINISDIELYENKIYFVSHNKVMSIDINSKEITTCIDGLPNFGDHKEVLIKAHGGYLFITIGAITNSGVVDADNKWISEKTHGNDTVADDTIGNENKSGEFYNYNEVNKNGEMIKKSNLTNSSLVIYNIKTGAYETYAWGIRNITGIDITNEGNIYTIVGGMENRGSRPIYNDSDYIYEIKQNQWYGFPDYSGGDPINAPRFKNEDGETQNFIMKKHPGKKPPAPIYQHSDVGTLNSLIIDKEGIFTGEKNCMYFYDLKNNNILYGNVGEGPSVFLKLTGENKIAAMTIKNNKLYVLDGEKGHIYNVEKSNLSGTKNNSINLDSLYISFAVIVITFILSIIMVNIFKVDEAK